MFYTLTLALLYATVFLHNRSDGLTLLVRTVTDYDREFLKDQLLASLSGEHGLTVMRQSEPSRDGWVSAESGLL